MKNKRIFVAILAGLMAAVLVLGLILSAIPAKAASSSELLEQLEQMQDKYQQGEEKLEELENKRNENVTQTRAILEQKYLLDQQVTLLYVGMDNLNKQIATYNLLIAEKQVQLDEAQLHFETLTEENRARIRAMEENGTLSYWSVLAKANSFYDLLDRLVMVKEIAEADSRRLKELEAAADAVNAARQELIARQTELKDAKALLLQSQEEVEAKRAEAQILLSELLARGEEYDKIREELEKEQDAALEEIAKKEEEYDDAKYSEYMATATKPTQPSEGNGGSEVVDPSGMTWIVPCSYTQVTSPFGMRYHPISGEYKHHNGVDLWGPNMYNQPIYASRGGYVNLAGWYGSGGNTVMIQHEAGYKSIYMHMSYSIVSEGDYVAAGQIIGYVGDSGGVTGTHLHFEIRKDGTPVNPMDYIG